KVRLDVEQVVLDAAERGIERRVACRMQPHQADDGVDLVHGAVGGDAQVVFLAPLAGAELGRAVVAGPRVDLVEDDHARNQAEWTGQPSGLRATIKEERGRTQNRLSLLLTAL